jgi:lipopolysaccharide/colanic/teichoic acid biosynthesis glycosyltransferase
MESRVLQISDAVQVMERSTAPSASPSRTIRFRSDEVVLPGRPAPAIALDQEKLRRALNVAAAVVGLILALPLMVVIALAIKLTSPGPVFYKQTRVGVDRRNPLRPGGNWRRQVDYGGRLFQVYKFRTMVADADRAGQVWATPEDPRITRVGGFLRKYRLDEIPQLWNVIRGDMNIVGPRPEQPTIFATLREQVEHYPRRQRVLPGITGWAQVNHHYDRTIDDVRTKLHYDLQYLRRQSVAEDLKIMLRTVPAVLTKKGAW